MQPSQLNFLAVAFATLAAMAIGFAWYSPPLFGRLWARIIGIDPNDPQQMAEMNKGMGPLMALVLIGQFFSAYMLARFLGWLEQDTWLGGMRVGFYLWIGFLMPVYLQVAAFSGKPMHLRRKMFAVQSAYSLVMFLVMGAILGAWR